MIEEGRCLGVVCYPKWDWSFIVRLSRGEQVQRMRWSISRVSFERSRQFCLDFLPPSVAGAIAVFSLAKPR